MASTASDLIKFEKMATGEKSGTWGTLANQAMSRLEEAIADITNISLNALGGANYTLDDTQYLEHDDATPAQESHVAVIKATGTLDAAEKIIVPLRNKTWWIWNATSGAFAVTVGGSSGNTVTVPQGFQMAVVCDGTNVEALTAPVDEDGAPQPASATVSGAVELATNAETVTGTDTGRATTPANITAKMAAPGTIGGTTPAGTTFTTIKANTSLELATGAIVTGILDEDGMGTDSATQLATQQSIKAYADAVGKGVFQFPISAAMLTPTTTAGCAAAAQTETTTNKINYDYLAFDASTEEHAYILISLPKAYNASTVTVSFKWTHPATATNFGVVWGCEILALANDDALDTAVGTEITVTDTGGTTEDLYSSSATAAITPSGTAAKEDLFFIQITRVAANGSDTMTVDAHLIECILTFTVDAQTDA